jgi:hypothetical protein
MNFRDMLSLDSQTQTREDWYEDSDGNVTIHRVQNVQDVIDINNARYKSYDERTPFKGEMVKIGSVPMVIYWQLWKQGILQDQKRLKAWLNDPDNRAFRARPGRM